MAMSTDKKLVVATGVLLALGAGVWWQKAAQKREEQSYSYQAAAASLPSVALLEEQTKQIDKITITKAAAADAGAPDSFSFEKNGEDWQLVSPIKRRANKTNVEALLKNLRDIKLTEQISASKDAYAQYKVADDKALHVVATQGDKVVTDLYFGDSGSRGQMVRVADKTGVFAIKGYNSYVYGRDLKGWRDMTVSSFDDAKVKTVSIENEHGTFEFVRVEKTPAPAADAKPEDAVSKAEHTWTGKFAKGKGTLGDIENFLPSKVDDMIRAYKSLNGMDFGRDKQPAEVGLDAPLATVTFTLDDGARRSVRLGKPGESSNRWVTSDANPGDLFTITQYAADWVVGEVSKYQKDGDKKDGKKPATAAPAPMAPDDEAP